MKAIPLPLQIRGWTCPGRWGCRRRRGSRRCRRSAASRTTCACSERRRRSRTAPPPKSPPSHPPSCPSPPPPGTHPADRKSSIKCHYNDILRWLKRAHRTYFYVLLNSFSVHIYKSSDQCDGPACQEFLPD